MKKSTKQTDAQKKEHLHRLCEELGADTIAKLHRAFELTAGALYRHAKQKAEAKLREAEK